MNTSSPEEQVTSIIPQRPVLKPRINVIEQVYWQGPDGNHTLCETRIGYMTECDDEPYQRNNIRIDLPWQQIDTGWLKDNPISQIVILNTGKKDDATIEVGIKVPNHNWILDYTSIKPGHSHRIDPTQVDTIYVRSRHKATKYSIRVYPL